MKIVQSIGYNAQTGWPTPFYYRRDHKGIHIRSAIGKPFKADLSVAEWDKILERIATEKEDVFGVTGTDVATFKGPKLYKLVGDCLTTGASNERLLAYISAILVHEGTLHAFHGQVRGGLEARVYLKRSSEQRKRKK